MEPLQVLLLPCAPKVEQESLAQVALMIFLGMVPSVSDAKEMLGVMRNAARLPYQTNADCLSCCDYHANY